MRHDLVRLYHADNVWVYLWAFVGLLLASGGVWQIVSLLVSAFSPLQAILPSDIGLTVTLVVVSVVLYSYGSVRATWFCQQRRRGFLPDKKSVVPFWWAATFFLVCALVSAGLGVFGILIPPGLPVTCLFFFLAAGMSVVGGVLIWFNAVWLSYLVEPEKQSGIVSRNVKSFLDVSLQMTDKRVALSLFCRASTVYFAMFAAALLMTSLDNQGALFLFGLHAALALVLAWFCLWDAEPKSPVGRCVRLGLLVAVAIMLYLSLKLILGGHDVSMQGDGYTWAAILSTVFLAIYLRVLDRMVIEKDSEMTQ